MHKIEQMKTFHLFFYVYLDGMKKNLKAVQKIKNKKKINKHHIIFLQKI